MDSRPMKPAHKHKFSAVILAAGKGTRMRSALPKVLHSLAGEPLIAHAISSFAPLGADNAVVVIAPGAKEVEKAALAERADCTFAVQDQQLGTGHAVRCALSQLEEYNGTVLILYGDTPLVTPETIAALLEEKISHKATIALLGMKPADPTGYGRLVMNGDSLVERIVEQKDATAEEKKIQWVWSGMMAVNAEFLRATLATLAPSPVTGEYYLTSLVAIASAQKLKTVMTSISTEEAMGINDRTQLAEAEAVMQNRLRQSAMENGATLIDPQTVYFSRDTKIGQDVVIYPQVVFGKKVSVADNVQIRSFSHIEGASIEKGAIIGPFARLRPGAVIGEEAHVGNFVELKNTKLGKGAKANHLSYVGDSDVGEGANIGAGTITCNYDGINKFKTTIGAGAFIGSNASLVAPVTIGAGAIVGAGSVITENVPDDALSVTRAQQVTREGKARDIRQKKQKKN